MKTAQKQQTDKQLKWKERVFFITGSNYTGTWGDFGMARSGSYITPHKITYEGEFRNGECHGEGTIKWPRGQKVHGVWKHGRAKELHYTFRDGLQYQKNWNYCRFPNRRFYQSLLHGLNPAGRVLRTNQQPTKLIPPNCYDAGDGFFDPHTYCITSYKAPHETLAIPTKKEADWIMENCRKGWHEPSGYRPWLYENWQPRADERYDFTPLNDDSPQPWWRRLSTFTRDSAADLDSEDWDYDGKPIPPPVCVCDLFVILPSPSEPIEEKPSPESPQYISKQRCEMQLVTCESMDDIEEAEDWYLHTVCTAPPYASSSETITEKSTILEFEVGEREEMGEEMIQIEESESREFEEKIEYKMVIEEIVDMQRESEEMYEEEGMAECYVEEEIEVVEEAEKMEEAEEEEVEMEKALETVVGVDIVEEEEEVKEEEEEVREEEKVKKRIPEVIPEQVAEENPKEVAIGELEEIIEPEIVLERKVIPGQVAEKEAKKVVIEKLEEIIEPEIVLERQVISEQVAEEKSKEVVVEELEEIREPEIVLERKVIREQVAEEGPKKVVIEELEEIIEPEIVLERKVIPQIEIEPPAEEEKEVEEMIADTGTNGSSIEVIYRRVDVTKPSEVSVCASRKIPYTPLPKQKYEPKSPIKELLFAPALRSPRADCFVRKPCDRRICMPTKNKCLAKEKQTKPCTISSYLCEHRERNKL